MQLAILTPKSRIQRDWELLVERHCNLTLRPLERQIRRVHVRLQQDGSDGMRPDFVCEVVAYPPRRRPVVVRMRHSNAQTSIAMTFARAKRDLLRSLTGRHSYAAGHRAQ